ncbi:hypothetical protein A6769_37255 [Nostoc punctiforme NIES-2108]|uniref:Uncharacterized protein n=1 Tax=Nostoc punctiforme NIES-2108 TaxID=1356359 RepID=A0A367S3E2_NOSPU|nr:hypothetical protein A6769_37255 [Nostoc punctiforme NIES-2108]
MKTQFKSGSNFVTIASGLISLGAILSMMKSPEQKPLCLNIFFSSISIAATSTLLNNHYKGIVEDQINETVKITSETVTKLELQNKKTNEKILSVIQESDKRYIALKNVESDNVKNNQIINDYLLVIETLRKELSSEKHLRQIAYEREDNRYLTQVSELKNVFYNSLTEQVAEVINRLNKAVIVNLEKVKMPLANKPLNEFKTRIQETYDKCLVFLDEIKELSSDDILLVLDINNDIYKELTILEIKWRGLLNIDTKLALLVLDEKLKQYESEYIPIDKAKTAIGRQSDSQRQELEKLAMSINGHGTDINELKSQVQDLLAEIESKNLVINKMKRPYTWSLATRPDLAKGNLIIGYFERLGIILDRAETDYDYWQSTLYFHIDRNQRIIVPSELEPEIERLKVVLDISELKFSWDTDKGLMKAYLKLGQKPAKPLIDDDIDKIWKNNKKFQSIVKNWERVRVTGGSQAGKSPTAENLAVCILLGRFEQIKSAELYNPQDNSQKNYWTVPTVGFNHADSIEGIQKLCDIVNQKTNDRSQFKITIFDEIDSTLNSADKGEQGLIGKNILTIIKQASHQNLGAIFIGQSANVKNYPGTDRSDWESAINVHIGANAHHAITNSNESNDEKTRLKLQADKLIEYCQEKNNELGLLKTDAKAFRFALVMGDSKPYFIQLPDFGQFTYGMVENAVKCPACNSTNVVSNGKGRKKCKDCKKDFPG